MANLKTSELTPASALTGDELLPLVQGAGNVSATLDQVIGLLSTADLADFTSGTATSGQVPTADGVGGVAWDDVASGTGDVVGPASATDNAIARFDDITGKLIQQSAKTRVADDGTISVFALDTDASNYESVSLGMGTYSTATFAKLQAATAGAGADDIGMVLGITGTGALSLFAPDGTAAGGNVRGYGAVDFVTFRTNADQVASGQRSFAHGYRCKASGAYAVAIGSEQSATGINSVVIGGSSSTASAANAVSLGCEAALVSGQYSAAMVGSGGSTRTQELSIGAGYGGFDAGRYFIGLQAVTTNATPVEALSRNTGRYTASANRTCAAELLIVARSRNGKSHALMKRHALIARDGSNNTTLIGSVQTIGTDIKSDADLGVSVTITADDTNEALKVTCTGVVGGSVASLTSTGTAATLTMSANHGLSTGDYVTIAGADQTEYNGTFVITDTGDTTCTFTLNTDPAVDTATGAITASIAMKWNVAMHTIEVGYGA